MGLQDSAAIAGLTIINPALGKMGTMLLGGASATQTMLDAVERGASDEQAIGLGLLSGAFEIFFEKYELDELLDNVKYAVKGAGKGALVKTMARQALSEGVGEGATEIANILADCAVMAEKSNWQLNIEKYITEKDMSPKEARKQAFIDAALQVGEAVVGGLISGSVSSSAYTGVQTLVKNAGYTKTGATIMDADGGVEALMNLANQVAGVSSEDVRNTLMNQIDKVNQNPTARNVGQLNATVQTATNQTNTTINPAEVAESLKGRGIPSWKIDTLAEAIVGRVNDQKLTRTQRDVLLFEQKRFSVRNILSNLIRKKTREVDSPQNRMYDKRDISDGLTDGEKAVLWNLAYQRVDGDRSGGPEVLREIGSMPPETFSSAQHRGLTSEVDVFEDNGYATVMGGSSLYQVRNAFSKRNYESGTDVLDEIKRTGEIVVEFNYNSKYDKIEFARQLADQQKGMKELTVQEYLDNRRKYIEQGRATGSNAAQQAAREKAFADKVDELQDAGLSLKEAEEQAKKWLDTQAVLHIPDQVAGGYSGNVGGVGDKGVNSSIGAQWRYRIAGVDAQIQKMAESMSEAEKNTTYLNVNLIFKGE